ncbi:MAG TPA: multicopper oxidase domain-containing protein, partial [Propionibacteriaceae bacterium]|nr:multicopper oxidase domain-containing protein [Propionibacteriaceae bacterium]
MQNLSNENNRDYDHTNKIMAFDVVGDWFDPKDPKATKIPTTLNPGNEVMTLTAPKNVKVRNIRVQRTNGQWSLNGQSWQQVIDSGYKTVLANPGLGDTEIWEIENSSGGWFHPVHIHLVDFKILSRNGRAPFNYELGPKDVVYVGENETVRVLAKFGPHRGKYMVHCHNLPHEDHDMMHQFSVGLKDTDIDDNDPIKSDPPSSDN